MSKNLFETYNVNGRTYTDNLGINAMISIPKKQYIEYEQQKEEIERLIISLQAQEELTMIWYNKVKKIREYIKEWQSFPHTNVSTHKELKNLMEIIDCAGSDKE